MDKNKKIINIILTVVVIAFVIFITVAALKNNKEVEKASEQVMGEIDKAATQDTTKEITDNIENINVDDTVDQDLNNIDQELEKL